MSWIRCGTILAFSVLTVSVQWPTNVSLEKGRSSVKTTSSGKSGVAQRSELAWVTILFVILICNMRIDDGILSKISKLRVGNYNKT